METNRWYYPFLWTQNSIFPIRIISQIDIFFIFWSSVDLRHNFILNFWKFVYRGHCLIKFSVSWWVCYCSRRIRVTYLRWSMLSTSCKLFYIVLNMLNAINSYNYVFKRHLKISLSLSHILVSQTCVFGIVRHFRRFKYFFINSILILRRLLAIGWV